MCGLVGMAGDFSLKHRDMMKDLIFFNTLRGRDSTGLTYYNMRRNEVTTKKATCPGFEFIEQPWIDTTLGLQAGVWLAHGRHKTVGAVNRLNAHPFEVRNEKDNIELFGAHNGTLSTKYDIEKLLGDNFGTDSEALLNLINRIGPKKAIAEARGAWALTWWDSADNSINFLRNVERPLFYTYSDDLKVLMWASESWMLRTAAARRGVKLAISSKTKEEAVWAVNENTLFKWIIPKFSGTDNSFDGPEQEGGLLGKPEEKRFHTTGNYGASGGVHWYNRGEGEIDYNSEPWADDEIPAHLRYPAGHKPTEKKEDDKANSSGGKETEKAGEGQVVGFEGEIVDKEYLLQLLAAGCDMCDKKNLSPNSRFAWLDEMSIVCDNCLGGTHIVVNVDEQTIIKRTLSLVKEKTKTLIEMANTPEKRSASK